MDLFIDESANLIECDQIWQHAREATPLWDSAWPNPGICCAISLMIDEWVHVTHGPCGKAPKQLAQSKNCHWKLNFRFNNQTNSIGNRLPCQHSLHSNPTCKLGSSKLKAANKGFPSPMSQISSTWQWQAENGWDRHLNLNIPTCQSYPNLTLSKSVTHCIIYWQCMIMKNHFDTPSIVAYTMLFKIFKNSSIM